MFQPIGSSIIRNLRPGYAVAVIVAGSIVVPATSHARDIVPSIRPIVALKEPAARLDSFILLFDAAGPAGSAERNAFKHHFFEQKNAAAGVPPPPPDAAAAATPAKDATSADANADTSNAAAAPDPNFDRWQKDASDRLKEENSIKDPSPHPLAAANPGKSVVVCEAGCRTPNDEIVYIAAIIPADAPDKKFEPNSSDQDDGSVPCIAGCYDREDTKHPAPRVHAEITRPVRVATAVSPEKFIRDVTAAIAPGKLAGSKRQQRFGISYRSQTAHNGAIVESHRPSRALKFIHRASIGDRRKASALGRKKVPGSWRAHVTRGSAQV